MAQQDVVSVKIPEAEKQEIRAAIAALKAKLAPHLTVLTVQERSELPKMGDKTVAFVQKSLEYGQKNAHLVPSYLDLEAFQVDTDAVQELRALAQELTPLTDALNDTLTLSGSEAYQGALVFYNSVKAAAKAKAPNAGSIFDDLSARFPGRGPAKKD
jgi:hypothetical protein